MKKVIEFPLEGNDTDWRAYIVLSKEEHKQYLYDASKSLKYEKSDSAIHIVAGNMIVQDTGVDALYRDFQYRGGDVYIEITCDPMEIVKTLAIYDGCLE